MENGTPSMIQMSMKTIHLLENPFVVFWSLLNLNILVQNYRLNANGLIISTAGFAAVLRTKTIPVAVASLVGEGSTDAFVKVPAGNRLCLILAVAEVSLITAHVAVDVVWKLHKISFGYSIYLLIALWTSSKIRLASLSAITFVSVGLFISGGQPQGTRQNIS